MTLEVECNEIAPGVWKPPFKGTSTFATPPMTAGDLAEVDFRRWAFRNSDQISRPTDLLFDDGNWGTVFTPGDNMIPPYAR